jgi:hypothetical protein
MAARADRPVSSGRRTSSPAVPRAAFEESLSLSRPMPSGAAPSAAGIRAGAPPPPTGRRRQPAAPGAGSSAFRPPPDRTAGRAAGGRRRPPPAACAARGTAGVGHAAVIPTPGRTVHGRARRGREQRRRSRRRSVRGPAGSPSRPLQGCARRSSSGCTGSCGSGGRSRMTPRAKADRVAQPVGPRVRAPHRSAPGEPVSRSHGFRQRLDQDGRPAWPVLNRSL